MIDARELRIGNWVSAIHIEGVTYLPLVEFSHDLNSLTFQKSSHTRISYGYGEAKISGIELTHERITEWCGFEIGASESNSAYYHKMIGREMICIRFMRNVSGVYFCMGNEQNSSYKIKHYLHELQNLVFALTGTELEIKIPTNQ